MAEQMKEKKRRFYAHSQSWCKHVHQLCLLNIQPAAAETHLVIFQRAAEKNRWRRSLALIWNTWGKSNAIAHSAINHNPAELSVIFSLQRPSWCTFPPLWSTVFKSVKLVEVNGCLWFHALKLAVLFIYFLKDNFQIQHD